MSHRPAVVFQPNSHAPVEVVRLLCGRRGASLKRSFVRRLQAAISILRARSRTVGRSNCDLHMFGSTSMGYTPPRHCYPAVRSGDESLIVGRSVLVESILTTQSTLAELLARALPIIASDPKEWADCRVAEVFVHDTARTRMISNAVHSVAGSGVQDYEDPN